MSLCEALNTLGIGNRSVDWLGKGNFSTAIRTKHNTVLKFTVDRAYTNYAKLSLGSKSALQPCVYNVWENIFTVKTKYGSKMLNVHAIELRRYKESGLSINSEIHDLTAAYIDCLAEGPINSNIQWLNSHLLLVGAGNHIHYETLTVAQEIEQYRKLMSVTEAYLSTFFCVDVCDFIACMKNIVSSRNSSVGSYLDLHESNIMYDPCQNHYVITDPLADRDLQNLTSSCHEIIDTNIGKFKHVLELIDKNVCKPNVAQGVDTRGVDDRLIMMYPPIRNGG